MSSVSSNPHIGSAGVSRPMVQALFVASCLLSVVSWYTTFEGMRLYLSVWFSILASLGIQTALVLVAWLIGFSSSIRQHGRRPLLIGVYIVTALVSIAFSYSSLYTWFSARERPAAIERKLYDALDDSAGQTRKLLTAAIGEQQKHVLALQEMTEAEKTHGLISRAQDADPYLANIRAAVAREAQTYADNYKEGAGAGVRYSAFDRYTKLAQESLAQMQHSQTELGGFVSNNKPLDSTQQQLEAYRQVYANVPWTDMEQALHSGQLAKPAAARLQRFCRPHGFGPGGFTGGFRRTIHGADFAALVCAPAGHVHRSGGVSAGIRDWPLLFWNRGASLGLGRGGAGRIGPADLHPRFSPQAGTRPTRNGARSGGRTHPRRTAVLPAAGGQRDSPCWRKKTDGNSTCWIQASTNTCSNHWHPSSFRCAPRPRQTNPLNQRRRFLRDFSGSMSENWSLRSTGSTRSRSTRTPSPMLNSRRLRCPTILRVFSWNM